MSFLETIEQARAFLERNGRVSLRALQREFDLADDALEELVDELVDVHMMAAREGKVLSWVGAAHAEVPAPQPTTPATPEVSSEPADAEHRHLPSPKSSFSTDLFNFSVGPRRGVLLVATPLDIDRFLAENGGYTDASAGSLCGDNTI